MRRSTLYLLFVALNIAVLAFLLFIHPMLRWDTDRERFRREKMLVQALGLTDICLFSEARYTRHPTQADRYSAFQDHPMALEHFPSGSFVSPPEHLTGLKP